MSDPDRGLDNVTVEAVNEEGRVIDSARSSVSGSSATGTDSFKVTHASGQRFVLRLTVVDNNGGSTQANRTLTK